MDRSYNRKNAKEVLASQTAASHIEGYAHHPIEVLRALSSLSEEGSRLGVFRKVLEEYGFDQDAVTNAALRSRQATIDFMRRGWFIEPFARMIPFLNAAIQGVDRWGRVTMKAVEDVPPTARKAIMGYRRGGFSALGHTLNQSYALRYATRVVTYAMGPSIGTYLLWRMLDRMEEYNEASDWQKDNFWMIPTAQPGSPLLVPKGFETGVLFGSGAERFLAWLDQEDPRVLDAWAGSLWDAFWPSMIPAFAQGTVENDRNRKFYFERPVEPRREQGLEAAERQGAYTSETAKLLAAGVRATPGLGEAFSGLATLSPDRREVSPREVDNLIYNFTAGLGTYYALPIIDQLVAQTAGRTDFGKDLGIGSKAKADFRIQDLPILRGLMGKPEQQGRGLVDRFYRDVEEAERVYRTARGKPAATFERYLNERREQMVAYRHHQEALRALTSLNRMMDKAVRAGDRKRQVELQKAALKVIRVANERAKDALEDPSAIEAVRIDRALWDLRTEGDENRELAATTIEIALEHGESIEGALESLEGRDRAWAKRYALAYKAKMRLNAERRAIKRVPKRLRRKVRERVEETRAVNE